ncbi:MAG: hypothetical protein EHM23_33705 [Acidobacteria bacterium]|nr:MAG: hypothetical protein EHM23_33705 [Acidobacteriota bacterium]
MGQRSDEIKKHIDTQRSELSENLERLEERVKSTTDWRAQVEKRPMTALGIAFGGGLLLGAVIPGVARRSSASSKHLTSSTTQAYAGQGYTGSSEGSTGSYLEQTRRTPKKTATSRELRKTWDMLDTIRAAMVSFGATKVKDYLGQAIPGFQDHYTRTEEEQRRERGSSWEGHSGQGTTGTGSTGSSSTTGTAGTQNPSYTTPTTGQR